MAQIGRYAKPAHRFELVSRRARPSHRRDVGVLLPVEPRPQAEGEAGDAPSDHGPVIASMKSGVATNFFSWLSVIREMNALGSARLPLHNNSAQSRSCTAVAWYPCFGSWRGRDRDHARANLVDRNAESANRSNSAELHQGENPHSGFVIKLAETA